MPRRARIVIRCPPKIKNCPPPPPDAEVDTGVTPTSVDESKQEIIRELIPDPNRKRKKDWTQPMQIPLYLRPFVILAHFFGRPAGTDGKDGRHKTVVVPLCICPDVTFYMVNFLHAPIIGYLVFAGWYCFAFREMLLGLLTEEVTGTSSYYCNLNQLSTLSIYGVGTDGLRLLLMAALIVIIILVGVVGFYAGNNLMIVLWLFMGVAVYLEYFLGHEAKSAQYISECYRSIQALGFCFLRNIDFYHTNLESYYEYGPARAVDLIQYSLECCGFYNASNDYKDIIYVPASCTTTLWNKNIYSMQAQSLGDPFPVPGKYIHPEGCQQKLVDRCRALRGMLIFGMQPIFVYHLILFIVGLIALILYFGMLRTSAIYSYTFNESLRTYTFPKKSFVVTKRVGEKRYDGRVEPGDLLRLHLQSQYIQNYTHTGDHLSSDLPEEAERFVNKLRRKLTIGHEDLGMYHGLVAPLPQPEEVMGPDKVVDPDACGIDFLYKNIQTKAKIDAKVQNLVSSQRARYFVDPQAINLEGMPKVKQKGPDFKVTADKGKNQLSKPKEKGASIWKWRQKKEDTLDVSKLLIKVRQDVADTTAKNKKRAEDLGVPPKSSTETKMQQNPATPLSSPKKNEENPAAPSSR